MFLEETAPSSISRDAAMSAIRPIRVLWMIKGLGRGGAELLLLHAAQQRDRTAFQYEVGYLLPWKDALVEDLTETGVDVHLLGARNEWDLRWAARLRRLLIEKPFDVLHVHSPYVAGVARLVARSLPRSIRPRLVSTEHVPWSGYAVPTRVLNAATFALDDAHLAVSKAVKDSIPGFYRQDVSVLVHGIPLDRTVERKALRPAIRAELSIPPEHVLVGTVANLRAQKGYPDLLAAARLVLDRGRDVTFAIVGQGPMEQQIREIHHRLKLGDRFRILGGREEAADFIAACDIFALASHYEGLPLALMEALALGLAVVATEVDGITELVEDGVHGFLVPPSRPHAFADALDRLIVDADLRTKVGETAARDAIRFDNRGAVASIERLYRRLTVRRDPIGVLK